ncbi:MULTISPECIES: YdeI/OmpD-associated family protein [Asticcacaulis]|uniref:YdeI/OmpD-associated family protein n=1 Tax=Asticcacaulis TaxID=76890 RepID=UPI0028664729|nr:YdeI/OmpD-associated family protein [Asticcacaulis sp. BE141]MBP2161307.1 uncharacterized protein YdeI (YjbR/CyaY-like superfamily) [Asticcacaulis solisilvae]MDR6802327.1 uncharacterized protein YdeI (YjbR/CyaY-like superfamily) [Asticcacaulis sp. BE141]
MHLCNLWTVLTGCAALLLTESGQAPSDNEYHCHLEKVPAMEVDPARVRAFATPAGFSAWLSDNHASQTELWLQLYKKASGVPSLTWAEAVVEALAWGWIDGIKKSNDDASWYQRFTPRKGKSIWSKINCDHVDRLIREGRMQPSGLVHVEAAKADGRWDAAYQASSAMEFPAAFLDRIKADATTQATFDGLKKAQRYSMYHRLTTAKREATREALMTKMLEALSRGEAWQ